VLHSRPHGEDREE